VNERAARGLAAAVALSGTLAAAGAWADWHTHSGSAMGTRIELEFWLEDAAAAVRLSDAVMAEMERVDRAYSPFREDSELSLVNRTAPTGWLEVSDEMFELLARSRQMSELTGGAFDVTFASVGRFYDYRAGEAPDDATVRAALDAIDYRYVELDSQQHRVRYRHPAVHVDLGGIAKGHAVDRGIAILLAAGVQHASLSAGGDSRIVGDRFGQPWSVGIRHPRAEGKMTAILPLVDTAVSTSGDYERFFVRDGIRFHHILDPETGRSATGAMSATVLGPDATLTDALSTSVFVLGPQKGMELINRLPGIDAVIVDVEGRLSFSEGLSELTAP
jgi:thiamine biosynthesis lipoprotein